MLRRQRDVFKDMRLKRLGSISAAHLYNLRHSGDCRAQRVELFKRVPRSLRLRLSAQAQRASEHAAVCPLLRGGGRELLAREAVDMSTVFYHR